MPTLRNVDLRLSEGFVNAFVHNSAMNSLKGVAHFCDRRDVKALCEAVTKPPPGTTCWHRPEVEANVNDE